MKKEIFIAGESGSVGVKLKELIEAHPNAKSLLVDKNFSALSETEVIKLMSKADLMFLALPEEISAQIIQLKNQFKPVLKTIDCSVLNRTNPEWTYGLPELSLEQKEKIQKSNQVSTPGCHATGAILAINGMVQTGIASFSQIVHINSQTGHSGGGKKEIEKYQKDPEKPPIIYCANQEHKHVPEIKKFGGTEKVTFSATKLNTFNGMIVQSTFAETNQKLGKNATEVLEDFFHKDEFIDVKECPSQIPLTDNNGINKVTLFVRKEASNNIIKIYALLDNLLKGSAGAAIQNMNLMLGFHENEGLQ